MKLLCLTILALESAAAAALSSGHEIADYTGFKVFRVNTKGPPKAIQDKLSQISFARWNYDVSKHMDIVFSPDQLDAFEALDLDRYCMHEDLGSSISAESVVSSIWKRQADDLSWFDSYHPYADHIAYFEDLQASFPNNSKMVSSGTSYEGRDIFGLHLWGARGPGKPAVLWHGTVHAREWITAMVR